MRRAPGEAQARVWARALFRALAHLHGRGLLHRDVKPGNLLQRDDGSVLLGDFGLARPAEGEAEGGDEGEGEAEGGEGEAEGEEEKRRAREEGWKTAHVASRWYRAPELLWSARRYSTPVDVWAAGCTVAELVTGSPLLPGESDIDQMFRVCQLCGTPRESGPIGARNVWPDVALLPDWGKIEFPDLAPLPLALVLAPHASPLLVDFLDKVLALDPARRPSAAECLRHPWLDPSRDPPLLPAALPAPHAPPFLEPLHALAPEVGIPLRPDPPHRKLPPADRDPDPLRFLRPIPPP
jgi:serine/threonine protein kinase